MRELITQCKNLAKYGIARSPDELERLEEDIEKMKLDHQPNNDPNGLRIGQPPSNADQILKILSDAEELLKPDATNKKIILTKKQLDEAFENINGAIKIGYAMGIPKYDPVSLILSDTWQSKELHDSETSTLWFAGKQLQRGKLLSDNSSIGKNEKTTIIAKLQKKGSGAPEREPVVDPELQKKLLSEYYKQQQESNKALEDEDVSYFNREWANPAGLKKSFQGLGNISWRGK